MRPVVIIQNDAGNTYAPSLIVAPMTTARKKEMPTHVQVGKTDRLDHNTTILAEQIRTIDKSRTGKFVCRLHKETMEKLDESIEISLGLKNRKRDGVLEEVKVFQDDRFGGIRGILKGKEPWFSAKDITSALGYANARDSVDKYVEKEDSGTGVCEKSGIECKMAVINEAGVKALIAGSEVHLEYLEEFKRWFEKEVIPELTGRTERNMNDLQVFDNKQLGLRVRTILNDDGSISVNAEDVARGFGWTTVAKSGNEVVRWARVNEYCKEIGFSKLVGKDDYIPESLFYRLGMKANNATAEKFQNWLAMDVIPSIRKTGGYRNRKMTPEEMMRVQLGMIDGHEERISRSEERLSKLEGSMNVDYGQQRVLEKEVAKVVIESLGGKDSRAYREMSRKVFAECNHDVKDYFHVNSRNNIPRIRFDDAVEYIKNWRPCTNTEVAIKEYLTCTN